VVVCVGVWEGVCEGVLEGVSERVDVFEGVCVPERVEVCDGV
jgi:hypothetical protein